MDTCRPTRVTWSTPVPTSACCGACRSLATGRSKRKRRNPARRLRRHRNDGADQDTDEVIELALLPFEYERDTGAIVRDEEAALRLPSAFISDPRRRAQIHGHRLRWSMAKSSTQSALKQSSKPALLSSPTIMPLSTGRWWKSTGPSSKKNTGPVRSPRSIGSAKAWIRQARLSPVGAAGFMMDTRAVGCGSRALLADVPLPTSGRLGSKRPARLRSPPALVVRAGYGIRTACITEGARLSAGTTAKANVSRRGGS